MKDPDLGIIGQRFWAETLSVYGLSTTERLLLEQICRRMDVLADLDAAVTEHGPMLLSDKGQLSVNPAVIEARQQSQVLHRMLSALALPDASGKTLSSARAATAHTTATTRWNKPDPTRRPAV